VRAPHATHRRPRARNRLHQRLQQLRLVARRDKHNQVVLAVAAAAAAAGGAPATSAAAAAGGAPATSAAAAAAYDHVLEETAPSGRVERAHPSIRVTIRVTTSAARQRASDRAQDRVCSAGLQVAHGDGHDHIVAAAVEQAEGRPACAHARARAYVCVPA
jgi:hypothetical protein